MHLQDNGFAVNTVDVDDLTPINQQHGIDPNLVGCHTAIVDGYLIEGHVPADVIRDLLKERPEGVAGLAVPGMPIGSPGMETPGRAPERYNVLAFTRDGRTTVFARR
ncbi:MAG: hypothetical protein OEO20_09220 [Gemmatimonadota bacterium]|nr:hypothetical protein [Gemmatimonadota bacterium]MDH3366548.1 hypothetical protein [Gemmatimonadota bacterium]MDH3478471.1 hypothetical protein [Gemmatimonadota bacterium]MDH3569146.1 hypothetical protein [Gemmatimonadota bacterium]MDH5550095.1 hypothetical protein [Gemmatimonadota bacterium]